MSLGKTVRKYLKEYADLDDYAVAEKIVDELDREALLTALADEVRRYRRESVRVVETDFFKRYRTPEGVEQAKAIIEGIMDSPTSSERFRNLMGQTFALGKGERVSWGEATADQHRFRANMLGKQIATLSETKQRHVQAANLIEQTGVSCLSDLQQDIAS